MENNKNNNNNIDIKKKKKKKKNENISFLHDRAIKSSNYDIDRHKYSKLPVKPTDICIDGLIRYRIAPMKRKIDNKKLFHTKLSGRNYYNYDEKSNMFFLDNKFKVINVISNRLIVVKKITFRNYSGKILKISGYESNNNNNNRLCVKDILTNFLKICDGKLPRNIFTSHPIMNELFHFIITNFAKKETLFNNCSNKMVLQYVMNNNNNNKNVFLNLRNKYQFKSRAIVFENNNDNDNNNYHMTRCNTITTTTNSDSNNNNYIFNDQCLIIEDIIGKSTPKIFLNISPKHVNNKYFVGNLDDMEYFVNDYYFELVNRGIIKYFK